MGEKLHRILEREFSEEEFQRIKPIIDLIIRNRKIRMEFRLLMPRTGSKNAIVHLADKYCLSEATIDWIVYKRRKP